MTIIGHAEATEGKAVKAPEKAKDHFEYHRKELLDHHSVPQGAKVHAPEAFPDLKITDSKAADDQGRKTRFELGTGGSIDIKYSGKGSSDQELTAYVIKDASGKVTEQGHRLSSGKWEVEQRNSGSGKFQQNSEVNIKDVKFDGEHINRLDEHGLNHAINIENNARTRTDAQGRVIAAATESGVVEYKYSKTAGDHQFPGERITGFTKTDKSGKVTETGMMTGLGEWVTGGTGKGDTARLLENCVLDAETGELKPMNRAAVEPSADGGVVAPTARPSKNTVPTGDSEARAEARPSRLERLTDDVRDIILSPLEAMKSGVTGVFETGKDSTRLLYDGVTLNWEKWPGDGMKIAGDIWGTGVEIIGDFVKPPVNVIKDILT